MIPQSLKPFLRVLSGESVSPPPIWLMRQAGRYLPEYREVRQKAGDFLTLCYTPALAAEVTLQPIRRYGFDAAILFSDILVVPHALGQDVRFEAGEGPRLSPVTNSEDLAKLKETRTEEKFSLVYETVQRIREGLDEKTALIGFCGAPWTVATYMVAGQGTPDQAPARLLAYQDPEFFSELIELLVRVSVSYLSGQIAAGAEAVQIFDSWAGVLPESAFKKWVIAPTRQIVENLKAKHPNIPIIGFPRGAGPQYVAYLKETGVDAVGCDTALPIAWIRDHLQSQLPVQGNLDPLSLVVGGEAMESQVKALKNTLGSGPHIFNLGHGIVPETPPEHVARLMALVRDGES